MKPPDARSPRISVVVATLNNENVVVRCIQSIGHQTYPNKELIIMDGGSTDGTLELLRRNTRDIAQWRSEPDRGIYHAWNKALKLTTGDWICFLGADDYFSAPDVLERMVPHLREAEAKETRVVYGQVMTVQGDGYQIGVLGEPWAKIRRRFQREMCLPHSAAMHHRSLFERHGKFDESFKVVGDYELLLRELRQNDALFVAGLVVACIQYGGVSTRPEFAPLVVREGMRALRNNGISTRSIRLHFWFLRLIVRAYLFRVLGDRLARVVIDAYRLATGKRRIWPSGQTSH